ncbi:acyl-CoA carboxylase subunit epsilon [Ornithinimicrobium kibberense]|uniref:Acyl-CoA carboxylase subunit epsilon n=1 Tax=Ornithinimicrobium kibberense TaxID=282060 RepID=A0ABV5V220_9MICO|nr:acyl-CoA carboxylase subunit epsilon [Ornithinimicrobium kibberense]
MSATTPAEGAAAEGSTADVPVIRVERGNPSPEQIAALAVVLSALGSDGGGSGGDARRRTLWTARSRFARPRPAVGPDGWRASALPR